MFIEFQKSFETGNEVILVNSQNIISIFPRKESDILKGVPGFPDEEWFVLEVQVNTFFYPYHEADDNDDRFHILSFFYKNKEERDAKYQELKEILTAK